MNIHLPVATSPLQVKGKVVPMLFLNLASRHEGVLWKWRYSSTHSWSLQ